MAPRLLRFALLAALGSAAIAQPRPQAPSISGIDLLRSDFAARSGGATIYFQGGSNGLSAQARQVLAAQALWIRQHPEVVVRVEGNADGSDTRDHALAVGARRAQEVRNYLVLLGVPTAQVSAMSWGKEHPGPGRTTTILVR
ncbi:MAG: OmpA family protein [Sphingomicrobium sp.]